MGGCHQIYILMPRSGHAGRPRLVPSRRTSEGPAARFEVGCWRNHDPTRLAAAMAVVLSPFVMPSGIGNTGSCPLWKPCVWKPVTIRSDVDCRDTRPEEVKQQVAARPGPMSCRTKAASRLQLSCTFPQDGSSQSPGRIQQADPPNSGL